MRQRPARTGGDPAHILLLGALALIAGACVILPFLLVRVPTVLPLAPVPAVPLRVRPPEPESPHTIEPENAPIVAPVRSDTAPSAPPLTAAPASTPATALPNPHARLLATIGEPEETLESLHPGARSQEARRRLVARFGGNDNTENAVEYGLVWLAAHQDDDGSWDRFGYMRHCPQEDTCPGAATRRKEASFTAGLTGLCALAFLGAGYADPKGRYGDNVARAVNALLRMQAPHGGFSIDESMAGYNDTLATFALAEYYALTRDARMVAPLERAVQRLALSQQPAGGWDYVPRSNTGRNDTSITAWAVQALLACSAAGIHVPSFTLIKACLHFERATEDDGRVWYADSGTGFSVEEDSLEPTYRYGPAMIAAGMTCQPLLGWRVDTTRVQKQLALLSQQPPSATLLRGRDPTQLHSFYYWYYGTVAAFQLGGESWQRWNGALRDAILPLQNRDEVGNRRRHIFGSWTPFGSNWGKWGRMGGRVYTTAICVLTLEIYYRHTPAYLLDETPLRSEDWIAFLRECDDRERLLAVSALKNMHYDVAEPTLVALLANMPPAVSRAAAEALVSIDNPLGREYLEAALSAAAPWARQSLERLLKRARELDALPPTRGRVRIFDSRLGLTTAELPRAYYGMPLVVERDGKSVANLRVLERFAGHSIVVAELVGHPNETPRVGDTIVSVRRASAP